MAARTELKMARFLVGLLGLAGVGFLLWGLATIWQESSYLPLTTPDYSAQAKAAHDATADGVRVESVKEQCTLAAACRHFSSARQACTTAFDFSRCMTIKVGSSFPPTRCSEDGKFLPDEQDAPSEALCLAYGVR
jgi:hypothetical protein